MVPENKTPDGGMSYPDDGKSLDSSSFGVVPEPVFDPQALMRMPDVPQPVVSNTDQVVVRRDRARHMAKRGGLAFAALLLVGGMVWVLMSATRSDANLATTNPANDFDTTTIPLEDIGVDVGLAEAEVVAINGSLDVNGGLIISPSLQPASSQAGQIYYDQGTNQLAYYNGSQYVALGPQDQVVQSVGGLSGQLGVGNGLGTIGNQIINAGVLSFGGQTGAITLGNGLVMGGNVLQNNGVLNVIAGANISVTNDGNGNFTINNTGSGTGTVTSGGGTVGVVPLFTSAQNIEDSIITQSGLTVTITGDLSVVTGGLSLSNALTVSNGGTGTASLAANGVIVGNGTSALTSVTAGGAGLCLLSTAGAPTWGACPGGSGVSSLNGLTGGLSIANASGAGSTITIDDASTVAKGIASFNSTNFSVASGAVNTIQNINSGATPTFAGVNTNNITPSALLTVGSTAQTLVLQGDGGTVITATSGANTTTLGFTAPTADVNLNFPALAAGTYEFCTTSSNCLGGPGGGANTALSNLTGVAINTTLLPGSAGAVNLGSALLPFGDIFLAGTSGTPATNNFRITGASNGGTRTITLPNASGTVCIDTGNCAGTGGGVTTAGGTIGTLPVFTASQVIGDSLLSQSGGVVTVAGHLSLSAGSQYRINGTQIASSDLSNDANLAKLGSSQTFTGNTNAFQNALNSTNAFNVQNAAGTRVLTVDTSNGEVELGIGSTLDGRLVFNNVANANTVTIIPGTPGGNRTITLPDDSGIVCLDTGNCAGAGATLQTAYNFSTGGTTPKIKVDSTLLGVDIQDADTTIAANLFNVRESNALGLGQVMFGVGNTGDVTLQNGTNSTTAFRLLTDGGTSVLTGDTQNGRILLGQSTTLDGTIIFNNATNSNQITLTTAAASAPQSITLPNASGTVCLNSGNCAGVGGNGDILQNGNSFTGPMTIGTNDAFDLNLETSGVTRLTVESDGSQLTLGSNVDLILAGATAYISNPQGQLNSESFGSGATVSAANAIALGAGATAANAGGIALGRNATTTAANQLVVGSSTSAISQVVIGNGVTNASPSGFVLQGTSATGTDVAGADVTVAGGQSTGTAFGGSINFQISAAGGVSGGSANTLSTVASFGGATGAALFQNATDSTQGFRIKNAAADNLFVADTSNSRIGIALGGNNTPTGLSAAGLQIQGAISLTGSSSASYRDGYVTPDGATLGSRINVENESLSASQSVIYVGLLSTSDTASRGITVLDDRASAHDPSIAVVSPDEAQIFGLSWEGANTTAYLKSSSSTVGIKASSTDIATFNTSAINMLQNTTVVATNSSTVFRVQTASAADTLFTANSLTRTVGVAGNTIKIGNSTGTDTDMTVLQLDSATADPTTNLSSLNGGLFYNSTTNKISLIENGVVKIICNTTDLGCGTGTVTLQNAYTNSTGSTTPEVKLDTTRNGLDIQDADSTIGSTTSLFAVRASNGSGLGNPYLNVRGDGLVAVGNVTPTAQLHVLGANGSSSAGNNGLTVVSGNGNGAGFAGGSNSLLTGSGGNSTGASAGGNGGATSITTGAGGNVTGAGSGNGGVGGAITITAGNGGTASVNNGGNGGSITLTAGNGGTGTATDGNGGFVILKGGTSTLGAKGGVRVESPTNNSSTAFQVLNASSVINFVVDTSNSRVYIGDPTADATGALLVLDTKNTTGDPTGVDGGMYYNSSMARMRCYVDGKWRFCNDPTGLTWGWNIEEEFMGGDTAASCNIGEENWCNAIGGTGANISPVVADVAGRPGQMLFETGTSTTGYANIYLSQAETVAISGGEEIEFAINIANLSDAPGGGNEYNLRLGLCDSANGDCTDGVYFEYDRDTSANWIMSTASGATTTKTTSSTAVATGWHRYKMIVNSSATTVTYYVDGTSIGTVSTNIPTSTANVTEPGFTIEKDGAGAGTTNRTFRLDYFQYRNTLTTAR